ncbi:MAG: 3'-5' exoribonuclease [Candidatus Auribacterota bacterium]|nr:3'-5' exoribonuclease [Candidatus Auribacterota bacterium]
MKIVFIDNEFTGVHAFTTLISVGLVTFEGDSLYVSLNDYDKDQVSGWVKDNVLNMIDESKSVSSLEACKKVQIFLDNYSKGEKVSLVSAGKMTDIILFFQLWHSLHPGKKYFHLSFLPEYLNHGAHYDLNTLFFIAGIDPDIDRAKFAGRKESNRHHALDDAKIVRECFLKLVKDETFSKRSLKDVLL